MKINDNILKIVVTGILLCMRLNINAMEADTQRDILGQQLVIAARDGYSEKITRLIQNGADPDYEWSRNGWTPLIAAASYDRNEIVKQLLAAGANPNYITNMSQNTALGNATGSSEKDTKVLATLIGAGANLYHKNAGGSSALNRAVENQNMPALKVLLNAITRLSPSEKDSIKNWLLLNQKMRIEHEVSLPRDPRILVAQNIYRLLAQDLQKRVIDAGALTSLEWIKNMKGNPWFPDLQATIGPFADLLNQYLNLDFLEDIVRTQTLMPKKAEVHAEGWGCVVQ